MIVDIDKGDPGKLPKTISEAYRKAGGSMPVVILADPGLKTIYGSYNHSTLRGQDYRGIFRGAKAKARDAIKDGSFSTNLAAAGNGAVAREAANDDYEPGTVESGADTEIEEHDFLVWKSEKGKRITAKLVRVEGDSMFIFQTREGRTIRASAVHLSTESVRKARELAGL